MQWLRCFLGIKIKWAQLHVYVCIVLHKYGLEWEKSKNTHLSSLCPLVNNEYTKMYLKYIYFMLSILYINVHIYVLNKNILQLYFWYTKLVKSAKLEQLTLYLIHFNFAEVVLKSN